MNSTVIVDLPLTYKYSINMNRKIMNYKSKLQKKSQKNPQSTLYKTNEVEDIDLIQNK